MLFPWMPLASRRLNKEQGGPFATRRLAGPFPKLSTQKGARFSAQFSPHGTRRLRVPRPVPRPAAPYAAPAYRRQAYRRIRSHGVRPRWMKVVVVFTSRLTS